MFGAESRQFVATGSRVVPCRSALGETRVDERPRVRIEEDRGRFLVYGDFEALLLLRHFDLLVGHAQLEWQAVSIAGLGL